MRRHKFNQKGFVLVGVILTMVLAGILIPLLYYSTDRESKWAVQAKHTTVASQLTKAGIDRAIWKLKETNNEWDTMLSTGYISGYNNDIDYQDVNADNGIYRIKISSDASDNDMMTIVVTAKDTDAQVYKAVQAVVRRTQISSPLHGYELVNSCSTAGDFTVHWGPIYATGNLYLNTESINQLYPIKYSVGSITTSSGVYTSRDDSPSSPNSDDLEYYAYSTVPPVVTPDFDYYRDLANTAGTYFTGNQTFNSTVTAPGQILFFEDDVTFRQADKFIQGIVIVMGKLTLKGNNDTGSGPTYPNDYTVTPPSDIYTHYQINCPIRKNETGINIEGDTIVEDEFPGDGGLSTVKDFTFGTTLGGASGKKVSVKGFLYVGTELSGGNTNPQVIHGALALSKTAIISSGKFEIFYDPSLEIRTAASEIYLDTWEEISPEAF